MGLLTWLFGMTVPLCSSKITILIRKQQLILLVRFTTKRKRNKKGYEATKLMKQYVVIVKCIITWICTISLLRTATGIIEHVESRCGYVQTVFHSFDLFISWDWMFIIWFICYRQFVYSVEKSHIEGSTGKRAGLARVWYWRSSAAAYHQVSEPLQSSLPVDKTS